MTPRRAASSRRALVAARRGVMVAWSLTHPPPKRFQSIGHDVTRGVEVEVRSPRRVSAHTPGQVALVMRIHFCIESSEGPERWGYECLCSCTTSVGGAFGGAAAY